MADLQDRVRELELNQKRIWERQDEMISILSQQNQAAQIMRTVIDKLIVGLEKQKTDK